MEFRPVEIKLISASGIKDVNTLSKMDVFVIVSVSGDPRSVQRSPIVKDGGINPQWAHYEMNFMVDEVAAQNSRIGFVFQIMSNRTLGDKEAGRVYIPIKELLDRYNSSNNDRPHQEVDYQVRTPSGKLRGMFKFSYTVGEKFTQKAPPIEEPPPMAYPAGAVFIPGAFPPPPGGYQTAVPYAAPYPSPAGYAAPYPYAPSVGYGSAPQPVATGGSGSKFGMGTGTGTGMGAATGIGMGLLGGLLIGEMVDDVADVGVE